MFKITQNVGITKFFACFIFKYFTNILNETKYLSFIHDEHELQFSLLFIFHSSQNI